MEKLIINNQEILIVHPMTDEQREALEEMIDNAAFYDEYEFDCRDFLQLDESTGRHIDAVLWICGGNHE